MWVLLGEERLSAWKRKVTSSSTSGEEGRACKETVLAGSDSNWPVLEGVERRQARKSQDSKDLWMTGRMFSTRDLEAWQRCLEATKDRMHMTHWRVRTLLKETAQKAGPGSRERPGGEVAQSQ